MFLKEDIKSRLAVLGMTQRDLERILDEMGVYASYDKISKSIIRPKYPSEIKLNEKIGEILMKFEAERKKESDNG